MVAAGGPRRRFRGQSGSQPQTASSPPSSMAVAPQTWWSPTANTARRSRCRRGRGVHCAASRDRPAAERHLEDRGDLARSRDEHRRGVGERGDRLDREAAHCDVDGRQPAGDGEAADVDADFLDGFAQRRFFRRLAGRRASAGQRDPIGVVGRSAPRTVSTTCGAASRGNSRISTAAGRSRPVCLGSEPSRSRGDRRSWIRAPGSGPASTAARCAARSGRRRSGSLTSGQLDVERQRRHQPRQLLLLRGAVPVRVGQLPAERVEAILLADNWRV